MMLPRPLLPAAFNLLKTFLGIGLLTFPYGFSIVGLGPGIVLTIFIVYLVRISMVLLIRIQFLVQKIKLSSSSSSTILPSVHRKNKYGNTSPASASLTLSFPQIVQSVFEIVLSSSSSFSSYLSFSSTGTKFIYGLQYFFQYLTTGILIIGQLGTCIGYLVFIHTNLYTIVDHLINNNPDNNNVVIDNGIDTNNDHHHYPLMNIARIKNYTMIGILTILLPIILLMKNIKSLYIISVIGILTLVTGFGILLGTCPHIVSSILAVSSHTTPPSIINTVNTSSINDNSVPSFINTDTSSFSWLLWFSYSPSGEPFWLYRSTGLWTFLGIACFAAEGIVNIPSIMSSLTHTSPESIIMQNRSTHSVRVSPKRTLSRSTESYDSTSISSTSGGGSSNSSLNSSTTVVNPSSSSSSSSLITDNDHGSGNMLIVLDYVLVLVTVILIGGGWLGWLCLGPKPPSILTLGLVDSSLTTIGIKTSLAIYILCTYPLQLYPVIEIMESYFTVSNDSTSNHGGNNDTNHADPDDKFVTKGALLPWYHRTKRSLLLRSSVVLFTGYLALYVHTFEQVISIIGWLSFGILSFIIPPFVYPLLVFSSYTREQLNRNVHNEEWVQYIRSIKFQWYTYGSTNGKNNNNNSSSSSSSTHSYPRDKEEEENESKAKLLRGNSFFLPFLRSHRSSSIIPGEYSWYTELFWLCLYCIGGIGITVRGLIGSM